MIALLTLTPSKAGAQGDPAANWLARLAIPASSKRGQPIDVRVTWPKGLGRLPVLIFSHGAGYSGEDYTPLVNRIATLGFVVLQPTHLDARSLALSADDPRRLSNWRQRRDDLAATLDQLPDMVRRIPALRQRVDRHRIVVMGHSFGGLTAQMLVGATLVDGDTGRALSLADPRIRGAVLLAAPGSWEGAKPAWRARAPYLRVDWSKISKPMLVIVGDGDVPSISALGPSWHEDPYRRASPGIACLLALKRVGHFLGGISPILPPRSDDPPDPIAIDLVARASAAWLKAAIKGTTRPGKAQLVAVADSDAVRLLSCR